MADEIIVRVNRSYAGDVSSPRSMENSVSLMLTSNLPAVGTRLRFGADNVDTAAHIVLRVAEVQWVIEGTQKLIAYCDVVLVRTATVTAGPDETNAAGTRLIAAATEIALFNTLGFSGASP